MSLITKSPIKGETDAKLSKIGNLQTSGPEIFGNSTVTQSKYNAQINQQEMNNDKSQNANQNHAMQQWGKVSGR